MGPLKNKYLLISLASPGPKGKEEAFPQNPGKFAKDGEQPTPQPEMRIDSRRNLKFRQTFQNFY